MANEQLRDFRVAILVTNGFEQVEMEKPRQALDEVGATTMLISPQSRPVQGMNRCHPPPAPSSSKR